MEQHLAQVADVADKAFDFVIVGGGLAGCVLAARLTENPGVTVALLEAGNAHFDDPLVTDPMGWMKQVFNPEYDWVFRTKPQTRTQNNLTTPDGKPDPSFYWSRGKGLGGSSCMNFLFWTRPQREEVDAIEKLGNEGWNWERFFEASKRSETLRPTGIQNDPAYAPLYSEDSVGHNGPVSVSFTRTSSMLEAPFQKALEACGIKTIKDGLGGDLNGTFHSVNNVDPRTWTRSSAASGYLIPALHRPNLKVLTKAYVQKVLGSNEAGSFVASGVQFDLEGMTYTVNAAKEVILSASTVKSPHILEMSGIGDRKVLEPLSIPVNVDLPTVGTNLQDHLIVTGSVFEMQSDKGFVTTDTLDHPEIQAMLKKCYAESGSDAAARLVCSGTTFLPLQDFSPRANELISALEARIQERAQSGAYAPGRLEQMKVQLEMLKDPKVPDIEIVIFPFNMHPDGTGRPYTGIFPSLARPFYRGSVHAASADPAVQPEIEPDYLSDEFDLELLLDSMKFVRRAAATPAWSSICNAELLPGPAIVSEAQLRESVRDNVSTTWHACGTCSMLPRDKGGVVDARLKVYGTRNLRVCDLSVLPLITVVHTQATTYGIAEQGADIIKADHGI
ncbi:GMC oxidoreductase [Epithele typhae]|uniref:GMC oxidoreductase n=1 Tax=Epithele typhae TaxID=378194 RepID=UPI002007DEE2|nr:GMC oxidoreductase [Epithele typhae]KAH9944955.1 GMC oxidoreductase [Epithele typhae]